MSNYHKNDSVQILKDSNPHNGKFGYISNVEKDYNGRYVYTITIPGVMFPQQYYMEDLKVVSNDFEEVTRIVVGIVQRYAVTNHPKYKQVYAAFSALQGIDLSAEVQYPTENSETMIDELVRAAKVVQEFGGGHAHDSLKKAKENLAIALSQNSARVEIERLITLFEALDKMHQPHSPENILGLMHSPDSLAKLTREAINAALRK